MREGFAVVRRAEIEHLGQMQPVHVAAYVKQLDRELLLLLRIRMLFDWLVTG